jgi:hypothetical protein
MPPGKGSAVLLPGRSAGTVAAGLEYHDAIGSLGLTTAGFVLVFLLLCMKFFEG